jgi:hypothetical protein
VDVHVLIEKMKLEYGIIAWRIYRYGLEEQNTGENKSWLGWPLEEYSGLAIAVRINYTVPKRTYTSELLVMNNSRSDTSYGSRQIIGGIFANIPPVRNRRYIFFQII